MCIWDLHSVGPQCFDERHSSSQMDTRVMFGCLKVIYKKQNSKVNIYLGTFIVYSEYHSYLFLWNYCVNYVYVYLYKDILFKAYVDSGVINMF